MVDLEGLLGKHIDEASFVGNLSKIEGVNQFWNSKTAYQFLGKSLNTFSIFTNDDLVITDVVLYLSETINRSFYDIINDEYGFPSNIGVFDKILSEEESLYKGNVLRETKSSLKAGSFENARVIYWCKTDYQMSVFLNRENGYTMVHFKKPIEIF